MALINFDDDISKVSIIISKMRGLMKSIIRVLLTVICELFLIYCGPKTLSDDYNEDVLNYNLFVPL
ncbi:MAG: hypothetical protein E6248_07335 [Clostridium sp.]|nr:hypothetical protein [Clostridium sp.]